VPTFVDRGCHVVSVMDPYGLILGVLDRSRKVFIYKDERSIKTFKRKHTQLSVLNTTLLPHKSNKSYTLNQV
jgi:hypothetical protein